ncbi:MAG TPA: LysR family transcriptional regulator [Burkholderiaceae bacterium]|nr:LysR family transcriptional regulator [Burkholderiaceae bacterium]
MIDIKLVESFVLLMRCGSLTRAEDACGISKATLSRQISKLEEVLGVQLLVRSTRRTAPTEAGRAFYARCEELLADVRAKLEAAQTEVHDMSDGLAGHLSLLSDSQFSTTFVCYVMSQFMQRYPNVRCDVSIAHVDPAPAIEEADCYICTTPPDLPNLVGKLLGRMSYSLYASPQYLQRYGVPKSPADLVLHKAVMLHATKNAGECRLHSQETSVVYRPQSVITTNDYWIMKTFCMDGFGIALLPDFFSRPEASSGALVPVLADWKPEPMRIYCAYQKQRYMGRKLRSFINFMVECFQHIDSIHHYVGSAPKQSKWP